MDKSKTINRDKEKTNKKESEKNVESESDLQQYISSQRGKRRNLTRRYKDLWRARISNKNIVGGFGAAYLMGSIFVLLAGWGLPSFTFFLASTSLFVLGSIIGSVISGYKYDFDEFLGFHIGIFSSIPMILLYTIMIIIANPISLVYMFPLLLINMIISGFGTYIYTSIGQDKRESKLNNSKHI